MSDRVKVVGRVDACISLLEDAISACPCERPANPCSMNEKADQCAACDIRWALQEQHAELTGLCNAVDKGELIYN